MASSQRPGSGRSARPIRRSSTSGRYPAPPPRRGGPGDRLPLTIAVAVVIIALILAGTMVVSAFRNGNGSSDSPTSTPASVALAPTTPPTGPAVLPTTTTVAAGSAIPSASGSALGPNATEALPTANPSLPSATSPYTVCLDPGHGGIDLGNVRTNADDTKILMQEKDLTLEIAKQVQSRLEAEGVNAVLTRTDDQLVNSTGADVNGDGEKSTDADGNGRIDGSDSVNELDELQARVEVCNNAHADLMISIHLNGAENSALEGYEAWYATGRPFSDKSKWFAQDVVEQLGTQFTDAGYPDVTNRGAQSDTETEIPEKDLPKDAFEHYVVLSPDVPGRNFVGTTMPGSVVETLFISNDEDYQILQDPKGLAAISNAYVAASNGFFAEFPEEGKTPPTNQAPDVAATPKPAATAVPSETPNPSETPAGSEATADTAVEDQPVPQVGDRPSSGNGNPERPPVPGFADYQHSHVVQVGVPDQKEIALTFDCGADRGYAEDILDLLDQQGAKGSFGMTGRWAEENPDLVKRMAEEGHMIINHTYSHESFTGYSTQSEDPGTAFRQEELDKTNKIIEDITGGYNTQPYWRPPYGDLGPQTLTDVAAVGYPITVLWTVDTMGWNGASAQEIIDATMKNLQPGEIVLMHVGAGSQDFAALPDLIQQVKDAGYSLVTVEQMFADGPQATPSDQANGVPAPRVAAVLPEDLDGGSKIR